MTRPRRGIALLVALWLIVAIAIVMLQFGLVASERRALGLSASDRGHYRAIAAGAVATMQARLEYDLRNTPTGRGNVQSLRSADPWLGADTTYTGPIAVDSMPVDVVATDLGTRININRANEQQLTLLLGFALEDGVAGRKIARAIMDWRDLDDNARPDGAEREQYIDADYLVLPTNSSFLEVDDLIHVYGMTPELLEMIRPYVTTVGTQNPNVNTAPEPVLRSIPGMTDVIYNQIIAFRSQGRRIQNINDLTNAVGAVGGRGDAGRGGQNPQQALAQRMASQIAFSTNQLQLTFFVRDTANAQPTKVVAMLTRAGQGVNVTWQRW